MERFRPVRAGQERAASGPGLPEGQGDPKDDPAQGVYIYWLAILNEKPISSSNLLTTSDWSLTCDVNISIYLYLPLYIYSYMYLP